MQPKPPQEAAPPAWSLPLIASAAPFLSLSRPA